MTEEAKKEAEIKSAFYKAVGQKLRDKVTAKKRKIDLIKAFGAHSELEEVCNLEQILDEEIAIMYIEEDIIAKDYAAKMYVERLVNSDKEQQRIKMEADRFLPDYMKVAEATLLKNDLSEKDKLLLQGLVKSLNKGFPTMEARNTAYNQLRDVLLRTATKQ